MLNALATFKASITDARAQSVLHDYLSAQMLVPVPFDDLLRGQVVVAVAAFDKLMHDIIRIGMCEIYSGSRPATPKYLGESINLQIHSDLVTATVPPKEIVFQQATVAKLSYLSFQHPDKIADGLSLIWNAAHKWQLIEAQMGFAGGVVATRMKLIASRRNAIVHESDMDPLTNAKTPITAAESDGIADFLETCGETIVNLVQ